jgi:hypothetical protein
MQNSFAKSARVALGFMLLGFAGVGEVGCGSSNHPATDARDAGKESAATGTAGDGGTDATGKAGDGGTDATGKAGDGGAGTTGTAGTDGGAGATGTAGADASGTAGTDGGAGATGTAGADASGTAGTDGGAAGSDAAAGSDGGSSDADAASDGACQNACTLGAKRCGGNGGIQTCVAGTGACTVWGTEAACGTHSACSATSGTPVCACNATSCTVVGDFCSSGTQKTTCAQDNNGCFFATGAAVACGTRQSCTGVAGSATCTCNTDPSCGSATAKLCATSTTISTCGADTDGCFFVQSTAACPSHESCTGSNPNAACGCDAPPADCAGAQGSFCATSTSVSTCLVDGNSCIYVDHTSSCGAHQTCTGGAGVGACTCVAAPGCTVVGDTCSGSSSLHCAKDTDNCIFNQATTACGQRQTCNGNTGLCECNASTCGTPGTFCDSNSQLATCAQDANSCFFVSGTPTVCTSNETCTGSPGSASCSCNAAPGACTTGHAGTFCSTGTEVTTCVADAHGCVTSAGPTACGARQSCGGAAGSAACSCNPGPAGCTAPGTFCSSTGTQSLCQQDSDHCFFVDAATGTTACPTDETCKTAGIGQTCTCDNTCTAGQVGTYCLDALHQQSCTNDGNTPACHIASNLVACVGVQTCQGADGVGACQCPGLGATAGTGCTTLGATVCQVNTVLTCINDTASGCHYWAQPNDCTASALVCGSKSGVAACQCAEHTGGDYFADPVAGSDAQVGVFPTGIDSPVECRYGTLGKALSFATAAGNRVLATGTTPVVFAAETFPLVVSPGVTLTTANGITFPSSYIIEFNSGATTGVSLGSASIFEGMTFLNSGGNAAASAVSITGTGVTIDTVTLNGTSGTTLSKGISVTGAGVGSINNATVVGFTTGLNVVTSSGPAVTLSNSHIDNNATGALVGTGTLSASATEINGGSGNGIVVGGALIGSGLTVTNMAGTGIVAGGAATLTLATADDVSHNGGGGISISGGTANLGDLKLHDNTGSGLTQSGGTVSFGVGGTTVVQANTTKGVTLTGGTLNVGSATITGNGSDGVNVSGGATLKSDTGAQYTNNGGDGILATSSSVTFLSVPGSPIVVSGNAFDGVSITGGNITASYLTLASNGAGAKGSGLKLSGAAAVSLGTLTNPGLSFTGNGINGVNVAGTTIGSAIDMRKAVISANVGDGISIDLNGGAGVVGATATLSGVTVSGNTGNGVQVLRAPLVNSGVALTMDQLTSTGNGGVGVYLHGTSGNVGANLTNSTVSLNGGFGVKIDNGGNAVSETLTGNLIFQNSGGGVAFQTANTVNGFSGNSVHGNTGDQILIAARQVGNANYKFSNASATICDGSRNQIYCYKNGGVGIRVTSAQTLTVDAADISWQVANPANTVDFVQSTSTIGVAPTCPFVGTCP